VASGRFFVVIKFLKEEEMLHVQEPPKHFLDHQADLAHHNQRVLWAAF
jgi:hypothetical protein